MRGFYGTNGYSSAEINALMKLRSDGVKFAQIRTMLVAAGFRDRTLASLSKAARRRRPQSIDMQTERAALRRSNARFCKALERERPQTAVSKSFGTDSPHAIAPELSGQFSGYGWVW